jgi:hypothetical protein
MASVCRPAHMCVRTYEAPMHAYETSMYKYLSLL